MVFYKQSALQYFYLFFVCLLDKFVENGLWDRSEIFNLRTVFCQMDE